MTSLLSIPCSAPVKNMTNSVTQRGTITDSNVSSNEANMYTVQITSANSSVDYYSHQSLLNMEPKENEIAIGVSPVQKAPLNNNRLAYVDALVDANALVIESIWQPAYTNKTRYESGNSQVVPLRSFIQEVLKRSRTTYSTLQTALFYLFRSRPEFELYLTRLQKPSMSNWEDAYIGCGRRMFLASLVVASKFVQDKTYRNSAWAKIAGLPVSEVNMSERIFLKIIGYQLYIKQSTFETWHHLLHKHVEAKTMNNPSNYQDFSCLSFFAATQHQSQHVGENKEQSLNTSPRNNSNNTFFVISSTSHLPPPIMPLNKQCVCQKPKQRKRKRNNIGSSDCCQQLQQSNQHCIAQQPSLSTSVPSSISSSPMKTPSQISPIRINQGTSVSNWNTGFDRNVRQRTVMNSESNKNRTIPSIDNQTRSYVNSHVRD